MRADKFSERVLLVSLHLSLYGGAKTDRRVTDDVISLNGSSSRAGKFVKNLFADSLEPIQRAAAEARREHARLTLPWRHGQDCLPAALFLDYTAAMRKLRRGFDSAVDSFIGDYDANVAQSKLSLGGLAEATDYPSAEDAKARFLFDIEVSPLPSGEDFRVDLADEERGEIIADLEKRIEDRVTAGRIELLDRVRACLERMAERLAAYQVDPETGKVQGKFTDSLVSNLVDLCDLLPGLNVTDDSAITSLHKEIVSKLTQHPAQALRDSEPTRKSVADEAKRILESMKGIYA